MKKTFLILGLVFLSSLCIMAQPIESVTKDFIEVTGTSETEVTPDEIYITITLLERMENKEKITIDKQEADLKQNLKELGIDLSNLVLNSADADYSKIRKSTKDVLINKSYILKISGTEILAKVYERLDKINAYDARISKYNHSRILELQKENRIKAIKAAKEKVDYLLAALGQQAGKVMKITETDNYVQNSPQTPRSFGRNSMQAYNNMESEDPASEISFKKIKIRSSFLVKYEILNK
jgi:uncharacterized protein YggE